MNISDGFVPIGKNEFEKKHDANAEALEKAIDEVVAKQLDLGIDVVNDGELPRENYFLHFVRKIKGIDADNLVRKQLNDLQDQVKVLRVENDRKDKIIGDLCTNLDGKR